MVMRPVALEDLSIKPVDPDSPIPLYYQVKVDIQRVIQEGGLPPGSVLPPEMVLSEAYGVGRQTMRMALSKLVDEHLLNRRAGVGTIVLPRPDRQRFFLDRSFTQQMAEIGLKAHSCLLGAQVITIGPDAPTPLGEREGEPCLLVKRVRLGNDQPVSLQTTMILLNECPGLEHFDLGQESLYEVLSRECNLQICEIYHTLSAAAADKEQAGLLQVKKGTPLLQVQTLAYLESGHIVERTESLYRSDLYEFSIRETLSTG